MMMPQGLQLGEIVYKPVTGRKKTNPVWQYIWDLRKFGLNSARCRFCDWKTKDRSPSTMTRHIQLRHNTGKGSLWEILEAKQKSLRLDHPLPPREDKTFMVNANKEEVDEEADEPFSANETLQKWIQQLEANPVQLPTNNTCPNYTSAAIPSPESQLLNCLMNSAGPSSSSQPSNPMSEAKKQEMYDLLMVAGTVNAALTFNDNSTISFRSNKYPIKSVFFVNEGMVVRVLRKKDDTIVGEERWLKADWKQLCAAIMGICGHFFNSQP